MDAGIEDHNITTYIDDDMGEGRVLSDLGEMARILDCAPVPLAHKDCLEARAFTHIKLNRFCKSRRPFGYHYQGGLSPRLDGHDGVTRLGLIPKIVPHDPQGLRMLTLDSDQQNFLVLLPRIGSQTVFGKPCDTTFHQRRGIPLHAEAGGLGGFNGIATAVQGPVN